MISQPQRINQSLRAEGIELNDLTTIPPSYSDGEWEGQTNLNPSHPEDGNYWSGYSQGNQEYWWQKKVRELPDEF